MYKHGVVHLRRVVQLAIPLSAIGRPVLLSARHLSLKGPRWRTPTLSVNMDAQATPEAATMPENWRLWHPDNGIVFGGTTAPGQASTRVVARQSPVACPTRPSPGPRPRLMAAAVQQTTMHLGQRTAAYTTDSFEASTAAVTKYAQATPAVTAATASDDAAVNKMPEMMQPAATNLDYKIPDEVFQAARTAVEGSPESFWSYALYRNVKDDGNGARVKVHYCRSAHTTERVCRAYFADEPLLGFDLEWMYDATRWQGPRRNVCLVQLASPSRVGLFHLSLYPEHDELVAPTLRRILEDAHVLKTGVSVKGDATRMRTFLSVDVRGAFELSHLHRLVKYSKTGQLALINKRLVSMAAQVQETLHLPMFKGQDVRAGDWSKPLTTDQILYAASDAYAAVQLFSALELERESLNPKPPRPAVAELNLPIKLADGAIAAAPAEDGADDEDKSDSGTSPAQDGPAVQWSHACLAEAKADIHYETGGKDSNDAYAGPMTSIKGRAVGGATTTPSVTAPGATPGKLQTPQTPRTPQDARIVAADAWVARYRASRRTVRTRPSALRAYFLWHGDARLEPDSLAALLREPPLQTNTVVSYVLDAVRIEGLPYVKERLRLELLERLPSGLRMTKYSTLARACGYQSNDAASSASSGASAVGEGSG